MEYKSTRHSGNFIKASEAIVKGIADDGGLYVPLNIPEADFLDNLEKLSYQELAFQILKKFLTDFSEDEIKSCVECAYDDKFETPDITPVVDAGNVNFLELYHGPTLAFKDMALTILPHLMKVSAKNLNLKNDIVILTATSGDTGKAALNGFADVDGTKILVFYPSHGVSQIQKSQMVTQEGNNVFVSGINGNFDDAQRAVKSLLTDIDIKNKLRSKNYVFSSANSINIGRLIPQIVYYFYGYGKLIKNGKIKKNEKINIAVPTGNFGNILAAYYAKKMGLPVNKFICASNINKVLFDFFQTGTYDRNRPLIKTASPSMDILVSSNLERLIYEISGRDENTTSKLMLNLSSNGKYTITDTMKNNLNEFYAGYAKENEVIESIGNLYKESGYVMDTHTAVAYTVVKKYRDMTKDVTPVLIASTASPFKFTRDVCCAIGMTVNTDNDFELINRVAEYTKLKVPKALTGISSKAVRFNSVIDKENIKSTVLSFLGIR